MLHLRSVIALSAMVAMGAFAQPPGPPPGDPNVFMMQFQRGGPGPGPGGIGMAIADAKFEGALMGFEGKVVKGAPYSAQAVTETTQVLADGTRISRKNASSIIRDSEGRTRREETDGQARRMIFINDPVSQTNYVLNASEKAATSMPAPKVNIRRREPGDAAARDAGMEKMRAEKEAMRQKEQANVKV